MGEKRCSRSYSCCFEGLQERKYFKHISKKLTEYNRNISVKFNEIDKLNTLNSASTSLKKIAFFDYDNNLIGFEQNVKLCKSVKPYYTNLNFDLWLLLHKKRFSKVVTNNNDYHAEIREVYGLSTNDDIKKAKNIDKILSQIELKDVENAINNAKYIMNRKNESDAKKIGKFKYFDNPSMNIHEFLDELFTVIKKELNIDSF